MADRNVRRLRSDSRGNKDETRFVGTVLTGDVVIVEDFDAEHSVVGTKTQVKDDHAGDELKSVKMKSLAVHPALKIQPKNYIKLPSTELEICYILRNSLQCCLKITFQSKQ